MRTRLGTAVVAACGATVMLAGAVTATAVAKPTPPQAAPPSTPTSPAAMLLAGDGLGIATFRLGGTPSEVRPLQGFTLGDTKIIGIDGRVQDGLVYGVGDAGGIYRIAPASGTLTRVKKLSVTPSGTSFGVDFNPVANALRIVSDTGQNLRQTFADRTTPTAVDLSLNYTAGVTATGITAAAYTNNDLSADSGTTLFDIDSTLDQLVTQAPANNGSLQLVGKLGADVPADIGFDIFTTTDSSGRATGNTGYAVVPGEASTTLHEVALLTGQAPVVRSINGQFSDIAIYPVAPPVA
jgi:hypothetical protein